MNHSTDSRRKAIVIGGMHRSGTSLAAVLIGNHSQVSMPNDEFNFFTKVVKNRATDRTLEDSEASEIFEHTLNLPKVRSWSLPDEIVRHNSQNLRSLGDIYLHFLNAISLYQNKAIMAEKSPGNEFHYPVLQNWLQDYDFKFIHMVRHPYDVIISLNNYDKNAYGGKKMNALQLYSWCKFWNRSVKLGNVRAKTEQGYKMVQYERLIDMPKAVLSELCHLFEIEDESQIMLTTSKVQNNNFNNSSFNSNETGINVGIIKKSSRRWSRLNLFHRCIVRMLCSSSAGILGYRLPLFKVYDTPS